MPPSAKPKYATKPTPGAKSFASRLRDAARDLGIPKPMPWQNLAFRLIGELRAPTDEELDMYGPVVAGGVPRRKLIIITTPRQSGKTLISRSAIHERGKNHPGLVSFGTAQTGNKADYHLERLGKMLGATLKGAVTESNPFGIKMTLGKGNYRLTWTQTDSIYMTFAPNDSSGHGDTVSGLILIDESWKSITTEVIGGVRPALATQPFGQMLAISTQGTEESEAWNDLVTLGRESTVDPLSDIAYLEYSAPSEDAVFDPSRWGEWMPALGRTISKDFVRSEMKLLPPSEFIRAYGNLVVASESPVFPAEWVGKAWAVIEPPERCVVAVDVNEEPPGATVTTGHIAADESSATDISKWQYGSPYWVPDYLAQMFTRRKVEAVVADFGGPARQIKAEIEAVCEKAHIPLVERAPRDVAADTMSFYDALREGKVHMTKNPDLEVAIRGSYQKWLGDLWVVGRSRMSVDASPIISTVLAHGLATELKVKPIITGIAMSW